MKIFLSLLIFSNVLLAETYMAMSKNSKGYEVGRREVILESIWEQVALNLPASKQDKYKNYLSLNSKIETKEVEEEVTETRVVEVKNKRELKLHKKDILGKLGGGKAKIAALLAKNRKKLAQKQDEESESIEKKALSYEENLKKLAKKNNQFIKGSSDKVEATLRKWKDKYKKTLNKWAKARESFLKREKEYKKATYVIPVVKKTVVSKKKVMREVSIEIPQTYHIIPGTLDIPIRDQGRRATCASFAGVRAIESTMAQNGVDRNLSEQYFYWASKPDCQDSPCKIQGSWVGYGLDHTKNNAIPLEDDCPYKTVRKLSNETYTPMSGSCNSGKVYVDSYSYAETLDEVIKELDNNKAVIAGLKLKENFYKNQGAVFVSDKNSNSAGTDGHAQGHAILFVGYIKLPRELHSKEGSVCLITANSWGIGWGRGGYACLSEKWILKNRGRNPFVAITSVSIK